MASFPLKCTVCPKDPKFSDVSHLLTHIASKGHLSHYFKIQVRSRSDPTAEQKLRTYDLWYLQHDIERLLSQRMLQKDTKRAGGRTSALPSSIPPKNARPKPRAGPANAICLARVNSVIDPALSGVESTSSISALAPSTPKPKRGPAMRRANMVRSPGWEREPRERQPPTVPDYRRPYHMHLPPMLDGHWEPRDTFDGARYPSSSSHAHGSASETTERTSSDGTYSTADSTCPLNGDGDETESLGDNSKLKGIIWPGMDLFDSASQDARRKRNQKKETGVLDSMRAQSEQVEPTEVIYFPSWDVKKARFISGEVESSPPSSVSPKKRQRFRPPRRPLSELDPNCPTARPGPKLRSDTNKVQPSFNRDVARMQHLQSQPQQHLFLPSSRDADAERNLEYGTSKRYHGRSFEVFDERSGLGKDTEPTSNGINGLLARNPLHAGIPTGKREAHDPFGPAETPCTLSDSHGLSVRSNVNNGGIFFQNGHSATDSFRHIGFRAAQATESGFSYHAPQPYHPPDPSAISSFYLGMPDNELGTVRPSGVAQQTLNPLAHGTFGRTCGSDMSKGLNSWDYRPTLPSGHHGPSSFQQLASRSRPDDSSGDETIDQGIDDCLDFFAT